MQLSRRSLLAPMALVACAGKDSARRTADEFVDRYYAERDHARALRLCAAAAATRVEAERRLVQEAGPAGTAAQPRVFSQLTSEAPLGEDWRFTYALTVEASGMKIRKEARLVVRKLEEGYRVIFFEERDAGA